MNYVLENISKNYELIGFTFANLISSVIQWILFIILLVKSRKEINKEQANE